MKHMAVQESRARAHTDELWTIQYLCLPTQALFSNTAECLSNRHAC